MNQCSGKYRSKIYRFSLAWMIACFPALLCGQELLGLDDAVKEGMVNNYQILVAKNETEMSSRNMTIGNAGFLPSVNVYGFYDKAYLNSGTKVVTGAEMFNQNAAQNISSGGIEAEWVLFDGTGMFVEYDKLQSLWKISSLEERIIMENVVQDIILSYCNIIRQKELYEACGQRLESSKLRYSVAREKFGSGMGSEQEWLQSHVALQADSTALITYGVELSKSKIALNRLLAMDVDCDFSTEDSIRLSAIPGVDQLRENSLQLNNLLKLNEEQLMYSKLQAKSLKSEVFPRLKLTGAYNWFENSTDASFIKYNRYFGPQVGLSLDFRVFDGMKLTRSIQNAGIDVQNKELLLQDMQQEVSAMISNAYLDYQGLLQTIVLGRERLVLARKNLDIAMGSYQAGMLSSVDLRVAQDDLFQASSDLVNAYFNVKVKETELLNISGMLLK
jgi:outer membrane protein TolC